MHWILTVVGLIQYSRIQVFKNLHYSAVVKYLGKNLPIAGRLSAMIIFYMSRNVVWLDWLTLSDSSWSFEIVLCQERKT